MGRRRSESPRGEGSGDRWRRGKEREIRVYIYIYNRWRRVEEREVMMKTEAPLLQLSWSPPLVDSLVTTTPPHNTVLWRDACSLSLDEWYDRRMALDEMGFDRVASSMIWNIYWWWRLLRKIDGNRVDTVWILLEKSWFFDCFGKTLGKICIREEKEEYIPKISPRPEFAPLWAEPSGTTLGAQNETSLPSLG